MIDKEENVVRKILKNEITWIIFIMGFVVTFFTKIIIPLNNVQLQLVSIQSDVLAIKGSYDTRITQNSNDIIVLQEQIKPLIQK